MSTSLSQESSTRVDWNRKLIGLGWYLRISFPLILLYIFLFGRVFFIFCSLFFFYLCVLLITVKFFLYMIFTKLRWGHDGCKAHNNNVDYNSQKYTYYELSWTREYKENIVIIEFFTIGVSVRLSDRSLHREEQKKFVKNCPQWGLKPGPPDLQANALPTELGRNLLVRRFLKWALFVSCTSSHIGLCSFLESIEHDFIKAMKI